MNHKEIRRELKRRGKGNVVQHYGMLVFVCLIAAFIGTDFSGSLEFLRVGETRLNEVVNFLNSFGSDGFEANSRGVLAVAANVMETGKLSTIVSDSIWALAGADDLLVTLGIVISTVVSVLIWVFVVSVYDVVMRRMFLEGRIYQSVGAHRLIFLVQVRRWGKASLAMLRINIQLILWMLTIVGGVVKSLSYSMAPFILAENPDITGGEAILLSRRMMKGHKWTYFVLHASFFPWYLLSAVTMGLSGVLFQNSYVMAVSSEFYAMRRHEAIQAGIPGVGMLCDTYLYEKAEGAMLLAAYPEETEQPATLERTYNSGVERFFCETFGVTLWPSEQDMAIERERANELNRRDAQLCGAGDAYPMRLYLLPVREERRHEPVLYTRRYSVFSLTLMFFCFAIIGWMWEVGLHLLTSGAFVNRGVLHGPWLPIYGSGCVLVLLALYRIRRWPLLEFLMTIVLCGFVEYFTSVYLEATHGGQRWWDYGGYFLNLHGRICAEGLMVFGMGGMAVVYAVAPALDNVLRRMKRGVLIALCVALLTLFVADQLYSNKHPNMGTGITDISSGQSERGASDANDVLDEGGLEAI